MFAEPGILAGVVARKDPESNSVTPLAGRPAKKTFTPGRKFAPVIVTAVPPLRGPKVGETESGAGGESVTTRPPDSTDIAEPRWTIRFFGPNTIEFDGRTDIVALVGATETRNSGIIGAQVDLNLVHTGDVRPSQVVYELTSHLQIGRAHV